MATATGPQAIDVVLQNPTDADLDSIVVEVSADVNFLGQVVRGQASNRAPLAWNTVSLGGFTPQTFYYARAYATDMARQRSASSVIDTTLTWVVPPGSDTIPPGAPTNLTANATSATEVTVTVRNPADVDLMEVVVEVSTDVNFRTFVEQSASDRRPLAWHTVIFSDLEPRTLYYARAYAVDSSGNRSLYTLVDTTLTPRVTDRVPPDAPMVDAWVSGAREVTVRVVNPPDPDLRMVTVEFSDNPNFPILFTTKRNVAEVGPNATNDIVFGSLSRGRLYYARGQAFDSSGNSGPFSLIDTVTIIITGISEGGGVPLAFRLDQNFPNPFNPQTTIRFALPSEEAVAITIYTLDGREIARLIDGVRYGVGEYVVTIDASQLATGMYLYRLTAGTFVDQKKMVVVR